MSPARAVVFAYHDVGVRCLKVLLSAGVEVPLVVTVPDDPHENRWYASVADTARDYGLNVVAPAEANGAQLEQAVSALQPDFLFSFYYRSMLDAPLLRAARRGALNMHGSLLPKFRGRAPVNWAILKGAAQSGATLHYMVERADAGDIVDQMAVPILADDEARDVFAKVTVAAESVLARSLPGLIAGTAPRRPQVSEPGQYFGRRRPEDGRVNWQRPALEIHNLVRAVAPPFPGAFAQVGDERWEIHRTRVSGERVSGVAPQLCGLGGECVAVCGDGALLRLLAVRTPAGPVDLAALSRTLERQPLPLGLTVPLVALKIDVDTYRGTREGALRLADLLGRLGVRATFLFSLGPDHTGRALKRVFRRGFLGKVKRTSVLQHYGLKTLLYGVLLPGPHIGRRCREPMRDIAQRGFEVGVHTWDHVRWQDAVAQASEAWTRRELLLARDEFAEIFGRMPIVHGAAGWQVNAWVPALEKELGFRYASDARGSSPFLPQGGPAVPQLPTTLPTLDELIGRPELGGEDPVDHLLRLTAQAPGRDQVFTLHAELEGGRYLAAFERLLRAWQARGVELTDLATYAARLHLKSLPQAPMLAGTVAGRSGTLAVQGVAG